jgi:hypothetical protein
MEDQFWHRVRMDAWYAGWDAATAGLSAEDNPHLAEDSRTAGFAAAAWDAAFWFVRERRPPKPTADVCEFPSRRPSIV